VDKHYRKRQSIYSKNLSPKKVNRSKRYLLGILLFTMLIWAVLGFIRSDYFFVEQIEINGNKHTEETEIRLALPVSEGDNIWQMNPGYLEDKLTEIPRVEHASVTRRFPRKLVIDITEKDQLALVPYQQHLLEIGVDGMVLGSTQEPQSYGLPLITGLMPTELTVGKYLLEGSLLEQAGSAIIAMSEADVEVSELNMADENNLILVTMDGLTVWLGQNNYATKAELLVQIKNQVSGRQAEGYLDLRAVSSPAFHLIEEETINKE
jgi:cell division protein FtsQ